MSLESYSYCLQLTDIIKRNDKNTFKVMIENNDMPDLFKESILEYGNFNQAIGYDSVFSIILSLDNVDDSFYYFKLMIDNNFNFYHKNYGYEYFEQYILGYNLEQHWSLLIDYSTNKIFEPINKTNSSIFISLITNSKNYDSKRINKYLNLLLDNQSFKNIAPEQVFSDFFLKKIENNTKFNISYTEIFKFLTHTKEFFEYLKNHGEFLFKAFFFSDLQDKNNLISLFKENILELQDSKYQLNLISYVQSIYLTYFSLLSNYKNKTELSLKLEFIDFSIENSLLYPMFFQENKTSLCLESPYYYHEEINILLKHRPFQLKNNYYYQDKKGDTILHYLLKKHKENDFVTNFIEDLIKKEEIDLYQIKNNDNENIYSLLPIEKRDLLAALQEKMRVNKKIEPNLYDNAKKRRI